jgi:probable phosphoglycerate mutase
MTTSIPDPGRVFAVRHGETEWSLSGRHTGTTDIPLTDNGRAVASALRPLLTAHRFALVLTSPMRRARETCALCGLGDFAVVDDDLREWNYGRFEGLTPAEINEVAPGFLVFRDGCPGGERPADVAARCDRVIARASSVAGDVALFSHGHMLRSLAARWLGLPVSAGQHFLLDTATLSVLDRYRNAPAIRIWNAPLVESFTAGTAVGDAR